MADQEEVGTPDEQPEGEQDEAVSEEQAPLTYSRLHSDIDCTCVDGLEVNTELVFIRECDKATLKERDFETQWERFVRQNKQDMLAKECKDICGQKGVSVSVRTTSESQYMVYIRERHRRYPDRKPYLHFIQLTNKCGCVKHTPNDYDPDHHDIYKSDSFIWSNVVSVEVKHAKDV